MERIYLNNNWKYMEEFDETMLDPDFSDENMEKVRIPHSTAELPYHYFDEKEYQKLCGYRKILKARKEWEGKTVLLTFEGVGHACSVYVNGEEAASHNCGYTAFTTDISKFLEYGRENVITVKVDSRESLNVPPFGFVIDYMTYGGIYRDVYLEIKNKSYIRDVFVTTRMTRGGVKSRIDSTVEIENPQEDFEIRQEFRRWQKNSLEEPTESDNVQAEFIRLENTKTITENADKYTISQNTGEIFLWDIDSPNLYEVKTSLLNAEGYVIDEKIVRFGYRKAVFHKDGFYLNGKKVKIRGLNRHQSYPYIGYAMPKSMQELDADILKKELGVNAVRTSHYPQSQYFIDRCDELGLLVFTELPGWQHIGDEAWKNQAVQNVEDMILQYRNHASIILWGVRINESVDDDEFYARTNAIAHLLDPSRQTGGVRCYKKGSLLEDVFTYNDFSHTGKNSGCDKKEAVTSNKDKPYLISEYNGHMFPCKAFDWEERRMEHAIRHANVLNDVAKEKDIAGSFGWCMFDYNTHKDFGSGDRICYHGVMDMFRNPKLAAYVYAAQQEETPVLVLSSSMDIGEHPGCNRGDIYIITNADSVEMYKNGRFIKKYKAGDSTFRGLAHGPIRIDDYIGDVMMIEEHMSRAKADALKELLNETAAVGLYNLPAKTMLKAGALAARYQMKMSDAVELYNKYIGDWGGESTTYTFNAYKGDELVKTLCICPMMQLGMEAEIDHSTLVEGSSYDVALVRIRAVDENGNLLPYCNDPVKFEVTGPVELIGPDVISLNGGMGGTYVKTTGEKGKATLTITLGKAEKEISLEVI